MLLGPGLACGPGSGAAPGHPRSPTTTPRPAEEDKDRHLAPHTGFASPDGGTSGLLSKGPRALRRPLPCAVPGKQNKECSNSTAGSTTASVQGAGVRSLGGSRRRRRRRSLTVKDAGDGWSIHTKVEGRHRLAIVALVVRHAALKQDSCQWRLACPVQTPVPTARLRIGLGKGTPHPTPGSARPGGPLDGSSASAQTSRPPAAATPEEQGLTSPHHLARSLPPSLPPKDACCSLWKGLERPP